MLKTVGFVLSLVVAGLFLFRLVGDVITQRPIRKSVLRDDILLIILALTVIIKDF